MPGYIDFPSKESYEEKRFCFCSVSVIMVEWIDFGPVKLHKNEWNAQKNTLNERKNKSKTTLITYAFSYHTQPRKPSRCH